MLAARNHMSAKSQWRFEGAQFVRDLVQKFEIPLTVPAAVLGLTALALLTAALWSPFADATGGCRTSPLVFRPGTTIDTSMSVGHDRACSLYINPGSAVIGSLAVDAAPNSGALSARGRTGVIYRSTAGFSGDDAFTITLNGKVRETFSTMTVKVRIYVK